ncbi:hypothetical protein BDK63_002737 [Halomonas campaniensis]|uniref:Uncharacterized protein n=1 Tax=Halomonas campaniensis TaxID=213554 RepID=A0A7W5PCB4_9GAMM|nr:hypothetical protein [Halomonas campaniensis]
MSDAQPPYVPAPRAHGASAPLGRAPFERVHAVPATRLVEQAGESRVS